MKIKAFITSMRPRTLLLSEAGVVLSVFIAAEKVQPSAMTVVLLLLTTALLQILSNLSNELGDTLHGTDDNDREGIRYSLQDGTLSIPQMKRFIAVICGLCCISGLAMIASSFGTLLSGEALCLIVLGACAIWAAMHYTLGANPYGYRGLGDISVFIFFGIVSVFGGYYVCSHDLTDWTVLLPAAAIGCFSVGVLNVNNIRDMDSDRRTRVTIAMKLGNRRARIYQTVLITTGWIFLLCYTIFTASSPKSFLYVVMMPAFMIHLGGVWLRQKRALDPMLPLLVASTFATALLMGLLL